MPSVPQMSQQISQEQNQQQNGPNLSLHESLLASHSGNPAFLQQVQPAGCDFVPISSSCKKNRNKRLIKKENLQKEVVLPELLTFTVEKYMPDSADVAAAAEELLPRSSAQIIPVLENMKDWTGVVGKAV